MMKIGIFFHHFKMIYIPALDDLTDQSIVAITLELEIRTNPLRQRHYLRS